MASSGWYERTSDTPPLQYALREWELARHALERGVHLDAGDHPNSANAKQPKDGWPQTRPVGLRLITVGCHTLARVGVQTSATRERISRLRLNDHHLIIGVNHVHASVGIAPG